MDILFQMEVFIIAKMVSTPIIIVMVVITVVMVSIPIIIVMVAIIVVMATVIMVVVSVALIVLGIWWIMCKEKNKETTYSAVNRDEGEEAGGKMLPDEEHGTTAEVTYLKNTMAVDTEEEEDDARDDEQTDFMSQSQLEAYHRTRGNTVSVQKTDASVTNDTKEDDYIANDEDVKIVCDEDARGDTVSAERIDELAM
eukprot:300819_1